MSTPTRNIPNKRVLLIVGIALAALLVGWLSQYAATSGGDSEDDGAAATVEEDTNDDQDGGSSQLAALERRDADDPLAMGDEDAPVVLIEYADFACPFCGKFARDTEQELIEKYVDEGVLRIEWRNFPVFGKDSERAALAAWAAGQQGRFWQFHEAAYADEDMVKKGYDKARLTELAEEAGVKNMDRFHRDRRGEQGRKALERDRQEAYQLGATSTPSFLVGGEPIAGAQPLSVFEDAVESAADAAKDAGDDGSGAGK
ncbi:DsbA family protein [Streptomyces oceani]|uniref:Disulfide bond formation protein DsbA n=1 Tax=Streptomyces oceani TaxID=1075402 RepID=A0A1E7JXE6_9ACTN|nr:DsbA family protein [Streptomyces oceani]OEU96282.1 disulfide bond formation protein DsbA [Streptomyces oceani]